MGKWTNCTLWAAYYPHGVKLNQPAEIEAKLVGRIQLSLLPLMTKSATKRPSEKKPDAKSTWPRVKRKKKLKNSKKLEDVRPGQRVDNEKRPALQRVEQLTWSERHQARVEQFLTCFFEKTAFYRFLCF